MNKELERLLTKNEIKEIRQLLSVLPKSMQLKTKILKPPQQQELLLKMKI